MRDWSGERIGSYQVICLLKQELPISRYLGSDIFSQKEVTLDLLAEPTDEMGIYHFQRNIPILQRLLHPSIVPLLDAGVQDMFPFVVLEHFPTSRQFHPFPLPLSTVVQYVSQLTEALDFAQSKWIVHRLLSPDAILIGKQGKALLGDFHLPLLQGASQKHLEHSFSLSPVYLAPEQISRTFVDKHTDQYALALVVYEWLCGVPPFRGENAMAVALQHIQSPPPSLRSKMPMLPLKLEQVIEKALAKQPNERFATIKAFGRALVEAS